MWSGPVFNHHDGLEQAFWTLIRQYTWQNENNLPFVKAVIPYEFSENNQNSLKKEEQDVIKKVIDRFNKDFKGCLMIR